MFRGAFVSRRPSDVLAEARWLGGARRQGDLPRQRELHVVRQGPGRPAACSTRCCPSWWPCRGSSGCGCPTCSRPRSGPACSTRWPRRPGVVPYFDISFQHASASRCCAGCAGSASREAFLDLLDRVRRATPRRPASAATSSSASPARPRQDLAELEAFLVAARLDVVGVFGYSDEDGTEAETVRRQAARRASSPSGSRASAAWSRSSTSSAPRSASARRVAGAWWRRSRTRTASSRCPAGPPTRGPTSTASTLAARPEGASAPRVGDLVTAVVVGTEGIDLVAEPR